MSQAAPKPFSVLDKAKSESYSDKNFKTFKRVEERMTRMGFWGHSVLNGQSHPKSLIFVIKACK